MVSWSLKRRFVYIAIFLTVFAIIFAWWLVITYYEPPTCFDGKQNNTEVGIDCGGACQYLCPFQSAEPVVLFSRSFEVTNNVYNAIAYVENPNFDIGVLRMEYVFKLYDKSNNLIAERKGSTFISAGKISPIFEGGIETNGIEPKRTFFELINENEWIKVRATSESPFVVKDKNLTNQDTFPRLSAVLENKSIQEYKDIEVVAVIFNANENAIATSRTFIDILPKKSKENLVFTWPRPLEKELEACTAPVDVMLLLDTSGSMNNDNDDPPQPLTDAKVAAADFVNKLSTNDRTGLITFATKSSVLSTLTADHSKTSELINKIEILPEEELGSTNPGDGLLDSVRVDADDNQNREGVEKILILLTDGIANEPEDPGGELYALQQVEKVKQAGFKVYTIGLGEEVNALFLQNLASTPATSDDKYFYKAGTSKDLISVYEQISDKICEKGAAIIDIIPRLPDIPLE